MRSTDPDGWDSLEPFLHELHRERLMIHRRELQWSAIAAHVADSGEHQKYGFHNPVDWLRVRFQMGEGAARDRITVGRHMRRLRQTVEAVDSGEVGFGHPVEMARVADALQRAHGGDSPFDEAKLLKAARTETVGRFHFTCENYRHACNAEAFARQAERTYEERELTIRRRRDGMFTIWGRLDPITGSRLRVALANHARRRGAGDKRSFPQRLHDAVAEHLSERTENQLNVTVALETLLALKGSPAAEIAGAPLLSAATVRRLACDSTVRRIVIDPGSVVVDVGRNRRVVTPAARAAVIAREGGQCGCPGCDRPGRDVHHLKPWAEGGPTDVSNQVLLCYWHHRLVHEGGWRLVRMEGGRLQLLRPPPDFYYGAA